MQPQHVTDRRPRPPRCASVVAAWCAGVILAGGAAASAAPPAPARPAARPRAVVDPAVVPAGGLAGCRECRGGCPPHHGHLDACRDGLCAPHCPVRPSEYGFYRTQWRRWPGQGVVPVSAEQAATPVSPPASVAPSADEESPLPPPDAAGAAGPGVDDAEGGRDPVRDDPVRVRTPADPLPEGGEPPLPPADPAPAPASPAVPSRPSPPPAPVPRDAVDSPDQSGTRRPGADDAATEATGRMRYPADVGRSIAAGMSPWRLQPAGRQRPADSARGL